MKYTFEQAEKSTVKIKITLTAKEWEAAQEQGYQAVKGKYSLPGFRKGKVPRRMLESVYGKGLFFEEAINEAFPKYYSEILDKEPSIEVVGRPDIDVEKVSEKGITMIAIVPVKPEVKLGAYKGIKVEKVAYNVSDEDVENALTRLAERNSRLVDVEGRAAENGDTTTIDYSGSVDGVKFDGGTAQDQTLVLGSNTFIPGFEDQVVGMNIGEEKDINVKFPEEYHAENLKGKDAVFHVALKKIQKKELPEINDEFIKDAAGAESVDAYKADTRKKMEEDAAKRAETETENKLVKAITETAEVEIPDAMVERQIDNMVREMEYRMMYQGLKLEDYLKYMGTTLEEYRKGYEEQAKESVKTQLVLDKILREEGIKATEEDMKAKIAEAAEKVGKTVEEYEKTITDNQREYMENDVVIKKLFDFLKANNDIQ